MSILIKNFNPIYMYASNDKVKWEKFLLELVIDEDGVKNYFFNNNAKYQYYLMSEHKLTKKQLINLSEKAGVPQ